jgi:hypothetical protein
MVNSPLLVVEVERSGMLGWNFQGEDRMSATSAGQYWFSSDLGQPRRVVVMCIIQLPVQCTLFIIIARINIVRKSCRKHL